MSYDQSLMVVLPELLMLLATCVILLLNSFLPEERRSLLHMVSVVSLLALSLLTLREFAKPGIADGVMVFSGTFVRDTLADTLKLVIYLLTVVVLVYSKHYLRVWKQFSGEFYVLIMLAVLGMMVLVSAASLLTVYLGLEAMALASYALVAMLRNQSCSAEAALKYYVLGALSSGMLLYGMSLLYGATGTLNLVDISTSLAASQLTDPVAIFALVFIIVGLGFKLGAVPFHMWVPDVYQGAATAVVAFLGSVTKLAAFALVLRVLDQALLPMHEHWQMMLAILAFMSLMIGNLGALLQENIKRMLAYSTISHVGFLLLGILTGDASGYSAALFYTIVYAVMSAGAFGMLMFLTSSNQEIQWLSDFRGLNKKHPWFALMMAMLMASLAGIPPFVGFFAKLFVLKAALSAGYFWLTVAAVIFAVIGAYYYLRVIKVMYFDAVAEDNEKSFKVPVDFRALLSANGLAQLLLGVYAGSLLSACVMIFS